MARSRYKLGEKIEVTWHDAFCPESGTRTIADACKFRLYKRMTIGYFVQLTEEAITVASTWDVDESGKPAVDDVNVIPVGWATEILKLGA